MTGIAMGIGATAIIGTCYWTKKKRSECEPESRTIRIESGKSIWDTATPPSNATIKCQGDHRIKDQEIDAITSPAVFPFMSAENRTLLAKYLDVQIYDRLCDLKTTFGSTLDDCIQVGIDNPEGDPSDSRDPDEAMC